jgi:rod shape-determining protein MreC
VTSGLGGRFPVGYPVGTVGSIKHPPGKTFSDITIKPTAHLETSREVLLVLAAIDEVDTMFDDEEVIDSDEAAVESDEPIVESDEPVVSIEGEGGE